VIDVNIVLNKDESYYPSKVNLLPKVGDLIRLESFSNLATRHDAYLDLKVESITHELVEFSDKSSRQEHYHRISINVSEN
jgi:hypothetical protein